jgi:glutathione peroxidase
MFSKNILFSVKSVFAIAVAASLFACSQSAPNSNQQTAGILPSPPKEKAMTTIYDFKVQDIDGNTFDFSSLKGKRILIVNTASECGYTPQYKQLQELYEEKGGDSFTVIGFPANNFGGQEPGSEAEIKTFCTANYGVTFPMMSKVSAKGKDMSPIYQWLTQKDKNGVSDASVRWNFHKFIIDENGHWVAEYPSSVSPLDSKILDFASGK